MGKTKKPRSAKQKAATRKLVARNKALAKQGKNPSGKKKSGGGSPKRPSSPRASRAGTAAFGRFGQPPQNRVTQAIDDVSMAAGNVALGVGTLNPIVGWLTGVTVMHPLGGAQDIATAEEFGAAALIEIGPRGNVPGFTSSALLQRPLNSLFLAEGLLPDAGFRDRVSKTIQRLEFNAKAAFREGHAGAIWGPLAVGGLVKLVDMTITPVVTGLIDTIADILPRRA